MRDAPLDVSQINPVHEFTNCIGSKHQTHVMCFSSSSLLVKRFGAIYSDWHKYVLYTAIHWHPNYTHHVHWSATYRDMSGFLVQRGCWRCWRLWLGKWDWGGWQTNPIWWTYRCFMGGIYLERNRTKYIRITPTIPWRFGSSSAFLVLVFGSVVWSLN